MSDATKALFAIVSQKNLLLQPVHIPSKQNPAEGPSRRLSKADSMLSKQAWARVQSAFGGSRGHTLDLMALDANAQRGSDGRLLPHFTPFVTAESAGVNLFAQCPNSADKMWDNPYVFPPFVLIEAVLRFLLLFHIPFTIVVPAVSPCPVWWPVVRAVASDSLLLGFKNDLCTIASPSKMGFVPSSCPFDLWAFRIPKLGS